MSGKRESALRICRASRRSNLGEPKQAILLRVNCVEIGCLCVVDCEIGCFSSSVFGVGTSS